MQVTLSETVIRKLVRFENERKKSSIFWCFRFLGPKNLFKILIAELNTDRFWNIEKWLLKFLGSTANSDEVSSLPNEAESSHEDEKSFAGSEIIAIKHVPCANTHETDRKR